MSEADFEMCELWPILELKDKLPPPPKGERANSWIYHILNLSNVPGRKTLRSVTVGRYRYSCDRWLREFLEGSNSNQPKRPTPGQRQRHRDKIKRELAEAGL